MAYYTYARPLKKRDREPQEIARSVLDAVVPDAEPEPTNEEQPPKKNPAAVALGRLGGKKGGPARAAKLTKEQRSAIAKKAAAARWKKNRLDAD